MAAIEYRGLNAVTNFDLSHYTKWLSCSRRELNAQKSEGCLMSPKQLGHHQAAVPSLITFPAATPPENYTSEDADEAAPIRHGRDTVAAHSSVLGMFNEVLGRATLNSMEEEIESYPTYSNTTTTSATATLSSGDDGDSKSSFIVTNKRFFPDDIQTFFECTQQESGTSMFAAATDLFHSGSEDMIFGEAELNSFTSSLFNFDQLHGS
uniref:Uncharacterized protein n=1 Tax=Kalanchoe fedtschenkoi TaxID=63787 RepID=A0A7N0ZUF1_KALFE